jgi:hypothetical protein
VRFVSGMGFNPITICPVALKVLLLFSASMLYVCIVKFKFEEAK